MSFLDWWVPLWQNFTAMQMHQQAAAEMEGRIRAKSSPRSAAAQRRSRTLAEGSFDAALGDTRTPQQKYKRKFGRRD